MAHSSPFLLDVPEYARRSFLLDPVTDRFFACMYTDDQWVWSFLRANLFYTPPTNNDILYAL